MSATSLDYITIEGFKSIASLEKVAIRPLNLVIGANGSGKSNFLGAFEFLGRVRAGRLAEYVALAGGAERVLHFGSKTTRRLHLEVSFREGVNGYSLLLIPGGSDGLVVSEERVWFHKKGAHQEPFDERIESAAPAHRREAGLSERPTKIAGYVADRLDQWRLYHLHDTSSSSPMRKTAKLDDNRFLRPDASNLAAFLLMLREAHPAAFAAIEEAIRLVTPFFDGFLLAPDALTGANVKLEWRHRHSDQYFDATSFSDGTLRFIALATLLRQPGHLRPSVVLLDEPELGLHPYAIEVLAALMREASVETQVIASTQSSLLLDHFAPDDVLVADRVQGATTLRRLEPAPLASWMAEYSLGQLWEKNEFGGRPGRE